VLVRGIGPALTALGVTRPLSDPVLTLFQGGTVLNANDNWDFNSPAGGVSAAVGIAVGSHTAQIAGKSASTGVALAEIYDATALSATATTAAFARWMLS